MAVEILPATNLADLNFSNHENNCDFYFIAPLFRFHSGARGNDIGFEIEYITHECGNDINNFCNRGKMH